MRSPGRIPDDDDGPVGALVTLDLPDDSPMLGLPWIITFGPLGADDEWEPVVCGPYERAHALALAEAVVAEEQLMAVVEPLLPALTPEEIRGEIAAAQIAAEDEAAEIDQADLYGDFEDVMKLTWFCHRPRRGQPCGTCNPCIYTIEEGLGERVPMSGRLRYHLRVIPRVRHWLTRHPDLYMRVRALYRRLRHSSVTPPRAPAT